MNIANFYDQSTPIWLEIWGEHMHHGHYGQDGKAQKDHQQAQLDLIVELLRWGGVENARQILDAGCGVGGSARFLAKRFDAAVLGVTLSPVQVHRGRLLNETAGLASQVRLEVQDMLGLVPSQGRFDLIWSMESAEHIEDKRRMFEVFYDLLTPGGKLIMATWCHRSEPPELNYREKKLLKKISLHYHLPPWTAGQTLADRATEAGFVDVQVADWSASVAPFWNAVIRSAFSFRAIRGLLRSGPATLAGAWAMPMMRKGLRSGLVRFTVLQAQKK